VWADKSGFPIDVNADGPYSVAGKVEIDDTRFFLTEASGDISERPLAGELKVNHGDREHTELMLQAADLNTQEIFPKITEALRSEFRKSLGLSKRKGEIDADRELPGDVRLRVIAGRLTDGEDVYRDVDVSFVIEGHKVSLPVAKLTTDSGLQIGLKGGIETRDAGSVGTLAYDLVGPSPDAMQDLVRKTGLRDVIGEERFKGLRDGKIAGLVRLGLRAPKAADVSFDGLLNGSKLSGQAEFDGGFEDWRTRPSRMQASVNTSSIADLLAMLGRESGNDTKPRQLASASLIAAGTLATGSKSQIEISSRDFDMRFDGQTRWPAASSSLALDGSVGVKALQGEQALAIAGLSLSGGAVGLAMQGSLDAQRDDKGAWTLAANDFLLGASKLSGRMTVTPGAGAMQINGDVLTDRVTVPTLLAAFSDVPSVAAVAPAGKSTTSNSTPTEPPLWPEGLFNFTALGNTNATVKVGFKSLAVRGGFATGSGTMTVALSPGKLTFNQLKAVAAGGQLTGQASFENVSNGVAFASDLKLDQAKLSSINASGKGSGTFTLRTTARAQSPAGLIAVLSGSGTAKLTGAEISGPSPSTVADVVDDVLAGKVQGDEDAIGAALVAAVGPSTIPLGDREFGISISDGSLKISGIDLKSADGQVEGAATADLATLAMNASFQVTSLVRPLSPTSTPTPDRGQAQASAPKGPLPPATVLYSGQLDHLAAVSVNADVGDLQRELTVRQMERNVEELEQARRADQERARAERDAERKRKEAAARAAAQQKALEQQQQQLPPVIPESAGTANSPTPETGGNSNDFFVTTPADAVPDARASNPPTSGAQPQNSTVPNNGGANSSQNATGQPVVIDPATGLPVPQPVPAVKPSVARSSPPPKPQKRRTSSDEVMKSLGGFQ